MVNKRYIAFCLYFAAIDVGFAQCVTISGMPDGYAYIVNSCNYAVRVAYCFEDNSDNACDGGISGLLSRASVKANSRHVADQQKNRPQAAWRIYMCRESDELTGKCDLSKYDPRNQNGQGATYQQNGQSQQGFYQGGGQYRSNPNASSQNNTQRQQQLNNAVNALQQYGAALDRERDARRAKELADLREQERSEAARKRTLELEVERDISANRKNPITNPF